MASLACSDVVRDARRRVNRITATVVAAVAIWLWWSFFSKRQIPFDRDVWLNCAQEGRLSQRYRMREDLIRILTQNPGLTDKKVIEMLGPPDLCIMQEEQDGSSRHAFAVTYALGTKHLGPIPLYPQSLRVKFCPDGSVPYAYPVSG